MTNPFIDRLNYYSDLRVRAAEEVVELPEDLPKHWVVCPVCNGEGKHVNPSIDAGGLTSEDFYEDPDFAEDYMGGAYDVTCYRCGGRTTVQEVDVDQLTPEQRHKYEQDQREEASYQAMCRAERIMGA